MRKGNIRDMLDKENIKGLISSLTGDSGALAWVSSLKLTIILSSLKS